MFSTGNDIVAFDCVNKERSNDNIFYSKILSVSEQDLYRNSVSDLVSFDKYLWMLWSIKESAYKFFKRQNHDLLFSPTKIFIQDIFPCENIISEPDTYKWVGGAAERCFKGSLNFNGKSYYYFSKIYIEFIATVFSHDENFENTIWDISKLEHSDSDQSQNVRKLLLNKLNLLFPGDELRIEKTNEGCPIVMKGNEILNLPVSLAHHGKFVSFSIYMHNSNITFQYLKLVV